MELTAVIDHVRHVADVRGDGAAAIDRLESALRSVGRLEAWLAGTKAALTSQLSAQLSFPEKTIAPAAPPVTRSTTPLAGAPSLADAPDEARVTAGHVDEVTKATRSLNTEQRDELLGRLDDGLLDVAAAATVPEWRRRLAMEVKNIQRDDGIDRLERQRRATNVRTWTDGEGMWCRYGRFDPVTVWRSRLSVRRRSGCDEFALRFGVGRDRLVLIGPSALRT